jgi:multiple sugar transport system substrate-binding protein
MRIVKTRYLSSKGGEQMSNFKKSLKTKLAAGVMLSALLPFSAATAEEINVMLGTHPFKDIIQENIQEFTDETGITVNLSIVGYDVLSERSVLEMTSTTGSFDVIADVIEWVPGYAASGFVHDIVALDKKYGGKINFGGMIQAVRNAHQFDGKQYSMPINAGTRMFFYRKDLLDAAGLKAPETWGELRAAAKALTTDGQYGMSMSAKSGAWNVLNWVPYLFAAGGNVWDEDRNITVNSDAGVAALDLWVDLVRNDKVTPPGVASYAIDQNQAGMIDGSIAMASFESVAALALGNPEVNPNAANMGYGRFPLQSKDAPATASAILGGWGLVIPKNTANEKAAYEFMAWATNETNDLRLAKKVGQGAYTASLQDPDVLAKFPALPQVLDVLEGGILLFPIPEGPELTNILSVAISDAITGAKTAKQALDDAAADMTKVLQ